MTVLEFSREAETTYIYREREREIDFKEAACAILGTGQSELCRAGQRAAVLSLTAGNSSGACPLQSGGGIPPLGKLGLCC